MSKTSCPTVEPHLKSIIFQIGSTMFEMKPAAYLLDAWDIDPKFAGYCIFGVIQTPDVVGDTQLFILGDVFLRHFYSVYDYRQAQV